MGSKSERTPDLGGGEHNAAAELPLPARRGVATLGAVLAVALAGAIWSSAGALQTLLFALGIALGVTLYHSRFGFASAFRVLVAVGQARALQAHLLMFAIAVPLFAVLLSTGTGLFGVETAGHVAPVGLGVLVGAFLFGIGMQLGGCCASGTLFTAGSGQLIVLITLAGFIVGSVFGAYHLGFWAATPALGAVSLSALFGWGGGVAITMAVLGLLALIAQAIVRRAQPPRASVPACAPGIARVVRGAWPLWAGAILLAGLNAAVLAVSGSPWGVSGAFSLWGAKAVEAAGLADPSQWAFFDGRSPLATPLFSHNTSVTNFGIILGALVASAVGGGWALERGIPLKAGVAALTGGVLMGYGAHVAYGCNIGAYFGGIASLSLHGWAWGAAAVLGTWVGIRLRPAFGLGIPRSTDETC